MTEQPLRTGTKSTTVGLIALLAFGAGIGIGIGIQNRIAPCAELPILQIERDTMYMTDTVNAPIPKPIIRNVEKLDTLRLYWDAEKRKYRVTDSIVPRLLEKSDTTEEKDQGDEVLIPRTSKVYKSDDYRAVVSGFRPSLDSMQVYPKTTTIRETVTKLQRPRWSLTAGVGAGYATDGRVVPHLGMTVGWVLWSK